MADAKKNLELNMSVTADTSKSTRAMKELTKEIDNANKAKKQLEERERFITSGQYIKQREQQQNLARMENRAELDAKYGRLGGKIAQVGGDAMGMARGAAVPIAIAAGVVQTAANMTKAWQQLDNAMLTTREKITGVTDAIPLIGSALSNLTNSVLDAMERFDDPELAKAVDEMKIRNRIDIPQSQALSDRRMKGFSLRSEVDGATYNRQANQAFPSMAAGQSLLRSGVGGMAGAFLGVGLDSIDPRLQAGLEAIQQAKQDAMASQLGLNAAQSAVDSGRAGLRQGMSGWNSAVGNTRGGVAAASNPGGNQAAVEHGRKQGMGNFGVGLAVLMPGTFGGGARDPGSQLSLQRNAYAEDRQRASALQAVAEQEQKINELKGKQLANVQKQHELAKAQTNLMQTQIQILDEKIARGKAGAQEYGSMDAVGRNNLLQAAKRFKEGGRESVTADEYQMLQGSSITRDLVGKQSQSDADADPMFKKLREIVGWADTKDEQRERNKLKTEMDLQVQLDKDQFAKAMEESLKKLNLKELLGEIVENQFKLKMRDPELGEAKRQAGMNQ